MSKCVHCGCEYENNELIKVDGTHKLDHIWLHYLDYKDELVCMECYFIWVDMKCICSLDGKEKKPSDSCKDFKLCKSIDESPRLMVCFNCKHVEFDLKE